MACWWGGFGRGGFCTGAGGVPRAACSLCDAVELGSPRMRRVVATSMHGRHGKVQPQILVCTSVCYGTSFASAASAGAPPRSFRMYPRGSFKNATSPFPFVGPHKASKAIMPKLLTTNDDMIKVQMK